LYIRQLNADDAESYFQLRLEALQSSPESFVVTHSEEKEQENPILNIKKRIDNLDSYTYGAFINDELYGIVTLKREIRLKIKHKANILGMYVSYKKQGQGIGKALLKQVIEKAKSLEIEQVHLSVVSSNESAKKLYTSFGFETYGIEKKALKLNNQYWDEEHMVLFL